MFIKIAAQGSPIKTPIYYVMSEYQTVYKHPVYQTNGYNLRLMLLAEIAFVINDNMITLIKHRCCDINTHQLSDIELKQYRWYILQAVDYS